MENKYLLHGEKKDCNGCGICTLVCPKSCIKMKEDEEGFLYPEIDESQCIHCNKCKKICSNFNESTSYKGQAFAAINKNEDERKNSASGGMFYLLAKEIIKRNGIVFGVEYDENMKVKHSYAETLEQCKKFSGSKYVRSDINNSYEKVKGFLEEGKYVLFTGTSCQNQALKTYLNKEYDKLILCDIICHANPSPKIFKDYVKNLEKKYNKKVISINFRSKENGWRNQMPIIEFEDHSKIEEDTFYRAFSQELINRKSCNNCKFASFDRQSDITIGDFWGIQKVFEDMDDDKGTSLILINTAKGKKFFEGICTQMDIREVDKQLALKFNHYRNVLPHKKRAEFFKKIKNNEITEDNIIKEMKKALNPGIYKNTKNLIKKVLKKFFR